LVAIDEEFFQQGEIMDIWQSTIEMEKWFDPAFQEFVDKQLFLGPIKRKLTNILSLSSF
jgi:hypothetical protein